mmetsp:Transcript_41657/g.126315  ORF Transcript_41657/g.126315 Transcript_41657/m.126315 type:complete len:221 (+) Transcript_41657:771-1433(+)
MERRRRRRRRGRGEGDPPRSLSDQQLPSGGGRRRRGRRRRRRRKQSRRGVRRSLPDHREDQSQLPSQRLSHVASGPAQDDRLCVPGHCAGGRDLYHVRPLRVPRHRGEEGSPARTLFVRMHVRHVHGGEFERRRRSNDGIELVAGGHCVPDGVGKAAGRDSCGGAVPVAVGGAGDRIRSVRQADSSLRVYDFGRRVARWGDGAIVPRQRARCREEVRRRG